MKLKPLLLAFATAAALLLASTCRAQSNLPPFIISQPQNILTTNGATPAFNVAADGTKPLAFQWQHNGTNFPGINPNYPGNGSNLVLFRVSVTNAGPYDVVITNAWGSVTSSVATLTIATPPVITSQPASQVVTSITNVTFSVGATGTGPFTYQWLLNGKYLNNNLITTVAGSTLAKFGGDGGAATNASLSNPTGVAVDAPGNLYIADKLNNRIRRVDTNGIITTVAGNSNTGYNGNGNVATNSSLDEPMGVAVDADGALYIADMYNERIRTTIYGLMITVAGTGTVGFSGDGGAAYNARLNQPGGVAVDAQGNVYLTDQGNNRVRKVDLNDLITTVAGNGTNRYSGDGGAATNASLNDPLGLAVDAQGNLFIADRENSRIRRVDPNGIITTFAGNGSTGYNGDGGPATNAWLNNPNGVAVDAYGDVFIADTGNNRIREVNTAGIISTVAGHGTFGSIGDGGSATNASLEQPAGVTVDAAGNLYVADTQSSRVRKVTPQGPVFIVPNANNTNAGNYQVIVSSAFGSVTSSVAVLTADLPPYITQQPAAQTIVNGSSATFSVTATSTTTVGGVTPMFYQWQFNGTNLPSGGIFPAATNASLTLPPATTANAGLYDVIITDVWGSVTSSVAALNIVFPPAFTSQPASQTVIVGGTAIFTAGITGTFPMTFQWQFNGTNLPFAGVFPEPTNAVLELDQVTASAAGSYAVVIASDWGSITSSIAVLNVAYPPAIANPPVNQTVINGSNTVFSVTATGTAPLYYQWQFNGVNLTDGGEFSGSASASLVVTGVTTNDAGLYDVVITNAWGSVTSSVAALTIVFPSAITSQPLLQKVLTDSNALFSVAATGTAPLGYQWQFNGINLTDGGQISGSATTNLALALATTTNMGNYDVVVTNAWGSVTSSVAALTIVYPPAITSQPASRTAVNGQNVEFIVNATGTQPLFFRWQHNGTNLLASQYVFDVTASSLTLERVSNYFAGTYDVVISNAWGSVTSSVVTLAITYPPVITSQPVNFVLTNTGMAGFSVGATGTGPLTYQWVYNGKFLPNSIITTVAGTNTSASSLTPLGDGGLAVNAGLNDPYGVAVDSTGNLFIADTGDSRLRKVDTNGIISTVAGNSNTGYNGNGLVATNSSLDFPSGVAVDADGDLCIADTDNQRIRAAIYGTLLTLAGNGIASYAGDGAAAYNAELNRPAAVAVDAEGNIFMADMYNSRIRKIDVNDVITTVAGNGIGGYAGDGGAATNAELYEPDGVAVDTGGNLYIADMYNQRIRKVDANGIITTVAGRGLFGYSGDGGVATNAELSDPAGLAVDTNNNLYIADRYNGRIRMVNLTGSNIITTVAGHAGGFSGDGGSATNAGLSEPYGVAVDATGNLFIADTFNNRIRKVVTQGPLLNLGIATTNNAGTYQVIVSSASGSVTSSVVTLTVGVTPFIIQQPASLSIASGGNATFRATAGGTAPLRYSWRFNGLNLSGQEGGDNGFTVLSASAANAGAYQLVVTNIYGSATSSVALLTVTYTPLINSLSSANGSFSLNLFTTPNASSRVLAATNLNPPVIWLPVYTNVAGTNGLWQFTDTNASQYPARFYRISTP